MVGLLAAQMAATLSYAAASARRLGLTVSEVAALEHLGLAGRDRGLTQKGLGEKLFLSSGSVTALVDRMERAGYVERRPNPRDRRSSFVRLTEWGVEEGGRRLGALGWEVVEIARGMSDDERCVTSRYVATVTGAIGRHARESGAAPVRRGSPANPGDGT